MSELKILICDDDPDLQGLLVRRLDKMGVKPDVASDGRQALNFVDQNNYDVIVTDIYMPEATGLEVLQHAKQLDQDTQVVIITSSATLDNAIDALNHGAFGYLTKPFDHLIVFDNMVSRAIEYRHLLVAEKRKAEAQKRRGDMLEDEVAQRVQQLQKKQKGLLDLLGTLPDGILVVEEGGKVVLSSPVGERWLARDEQSEQRPIHAFIAQVHAEMAEPSAQVQLGDRELQLMAADFPDDGDAKRKAVIIREFEESGVGAGSLVTDTVMGIKKGLATLYEQGLGTEIVLNLANQFAVLEQLSGWTGGTGQLKPVGADTPAPAVPNPPAPAASPPAAPPAQEQPPAVSQPPATAEPPAQEQPPAVSQPPAAAEPQVETDPQPTTASSTPPFMEPRQRVPTAELDEPRMNTAELEEALRSGVATQTEQPADAPAPSGLQVEDTQPAAGQAEASAPSPPAEPQQASVLPEAEQPPAPQADVQTPPPPTDQPSAAQAAVEPDPAPAAQSEQPAAPAAAPAAEPTAPAAVQPEPLPASNGTGELEPPSAEPVEFPPAPPSTGELDSSIFRPRLIPEEMDAKLETPTDLPNVNGKRGLLNRAKGPLKISSPQADTQIFRKVLAGLSGSEVEGLSGEKEGPPEAKPRSEPAPEPASTKPEAPADDPPEAQLEQATEPDPEPAPEPEPQSEAELMAQPQKPKASNWPPKRPSEDPQWDEELDVSG